MSTKKTIPAFCYPTTPKVIVLTSIPSEVHRARSKKTNALVALKKIIMHNEKDGVSLCLRTLLLE